MSTQTWTLFPTTIRKSPPAIYVLKDLDRITKVQEETSWEAENRRLRGGIIQHAPAIARLLKNVVLHRGYLYSGAMKLTLEPRRETFGLAVLTPVKSAALACTFVGNRYFGHSICDDIPLNMLASTLAPAARTAAVLTEHQIAYRRLAQVSATDHESAVFNSLLILEDFGQNNGKRDRYALMRNRFVSGCRDPGHRRVFISRGTSGKPRSLVNEARLAQELQQQGFRCIEPESMTASEIIQALAHATIVIGCEGSQLAHAAFTMNSAGVLVVLQPPFRFNNVFKDYADTIGLRYAIVIGRVAQDGFTIDLTDIMRTIDLAGHSVTDLF